MDECARISRAFHDLLGSAMARLRLYYAARIGGVMLCRRRDRNVAVMALQGECDAALEALRFSMMGEKERALEEARDRAKRLRLPPALDEVEFELPVRLARRPAAGRRLAVGTPARPQSRP